MARIFETLPNIPTGLSAKPAQPEPDFLARNVGGALESFGRGAEHVAQLPFNKETFTEELARTYPEKYGFLNQANQRAAKSPTSELLKIAGRPEGYGESRNYGESALRFGLTELPFIWATGGLASPSALFKSVITSGAAQAGAKVGQLGAEYAGLGERGQAGAALIGGTAGAGLANLGREAVNIKKSTHKLEEEAFNKKKAMDLDAYTENYQNALKQNEISKLENLKKVDNNIVNYDKNIEQLKADQKRLYAEAKQFENTKLPAGDIKDRLEVIDKNLRKGVVRPQRATVKDILGQLEETIKGGEMSLADAKIFKQNLNAEVYNRKLAPLIKKNNQQIVEILNEFIAKAESAHEVPFRQAENTTIKIADLKEKRPEVVKQSLRDKSLIEAEARRAKALETKEFQNLKKTESQRTYEDSLKEQKIKEALESKMDFWNQVGTQLSDATFSALSGLAFGYKGGLATKALLETGRYAAKEMAKANALLQKHPQLKAQAKSIITDAAKPTTAAFTAKVLKFDKAMRDYSDEPETPQRKRYIESIPG